ncbi:Uncharacterized protein DAT39_022495 [Clarias magur]|uniref:Uncharacterized protein n=1 Tax=Clarias magur TaxID=1594786 RepID=A0A8J4TMM1_CLAMG|nr:Uncharacterized protein DAT39_022495 [Clarias magur]
MESLESHPSASTAAERRSVALGSHSSPSSASLFSSFMRRITAFSRRGTFHILTRLVREADTTDTRSAETSGLASSVCDCVHHSESEANLERTRSQKAPIPCW